MRNNSKIKTTVYVDGFNLYYGCLKNSAYKWLNLKALFRLLLKEHNITAIKYYTARISAREQDPYAPGRQKVYLTALTKYIPELQVFYGHFLDSVVHAKVNKPPKGCPSFVKVHKTEEKGSDVNMAVHILNDAWLNAYDCAVIVSNDSDLSEALKLSKIDHHKKIGLLLPMMDTKKRRPSNELKKHADFIKSIRKGALASSQLPEQIPGTKICKPENW